MSDNLKPLQCEGTREFDRVIDAIQSPIVFDIGANGGGYVETFLQKGASEIYAFEPVPDMFDKLYNRFAGDNRVYISDLAISDVHGKVIKDVKPHLAWALLPFTKQPVGVALDYVDKPAFDIRTTTLDDYVEFMEVIPNFVKIDVDGYELKVLKGGEKLFRENRPPILFEFSYLPHLFGDSVYAMCCFIYELGYEAVSMDGAYRCKSPEQMMTHFPEHTSYDIMLEAQ